MHGLFATCPHPCAGSFTPSPPSSVSSRRHCGRRASRSPSPGRPALAGGPDRLPPQDPAAGYTADGAPDRRIRRGAARLHPHPGRAPVLKQAIPPPRTTASTSTRRRLPGHPAGRRRQPRNRRQTPGRLDDHHAGGAQLLPHPREDHFRKLYEILSPSRSSKTTKDQILEVTSTRSSSAARLRLRGGLAYLFRETHPRLNIPEAADARRPAQGAPPTTRWSIRSAPQLRQQYVLRRMLELGFISEAEQRRPSTRPLEGGHQRHRLRRQRRLRGRDGPPDRLRAVPGRGLHPRHQGHHHHHQGRAGGRLPGPCAAASWTTTAATATAAPRPTSTRPA